jgi:plastocyanin
MSSRHTSLTRLALTVPAAAAIAVAGCGGGDDKSDSGSKVNSYSPPAAKSKPKPAAGGLQLSADPTGKIAFDKKVLKTKAGKVTITMKNPSGSGVPHAVAVEGNGVDKDGATAQPGSDSSVSVSLKPGKYEFYCPVDDHKAEGMEGTLTVN